MEDVLVSATDTLSGAVRFAGTPVPVHALLDTLITDSTLDDFLEGYPNVSREQAQAVIGWEQEVSRALLGLQTN